MNRAQRLDITAIAETFLRKAKRFLWQDGHLTPVAFIVHSTGVETIVLSFKDTEEKHQAYVFVSALSRKLRADAVILINENWMVLSSGESRDEVIARTEQLPPSEDPRRQEVISMAVVGPAFKPTITLLPFRRKG